MLTDVVVRKAAPKESPYKLSDAQGLYLLVKPNGTKRWRLKYRFGGKEKALSFGAYPEVSLINAKRARESAREELRNGQDPSLTRQQKRAEAVRTDNQFRTSCTGVDCGAWQAVDASASIRGSEYAGTLCLPKDRKPIP